MGNKSSLKLLGEVIEQEISQAVGYIQELKQDLNDERSRLAMMNKLRRRVGKIAIDGGVDVLFHTRGVIFWVNKKGILPMINSLRKALGIVFTIKYEKYKDLIDEGEAVTSDGLKIKVIRRRCFDTKYKFLIADIFATEVVAR